MKNMLSNKKTAIVLLIVTLLAIGYCAFMFARPISYAMDYHTTMEYEGQTFEGTLVFFDDGTMMNRNSTFGEGIPSFYYYKNGYVFSSLAETREALEEEIAYIDANFEEAVNTPFYAAKVNAFRYVLEGADGYDAVYTCTTAIALAVVDGLAVCLLLGLTCASLILCSKKKAVRSA